MVGAALLSAAVAGCPAPPVHTTPNPLLPREFVRGSRWIAPEPRRLLAVMWSGRAVDGRFSVYARGVNPVTGIAEKIMWVVPARATARANRGMRIAWRRGDRRYVQDDPSGVGKPLGKRLDEPLIYPSTLRAPSPGCWRLTLRTGRIKTTMRVLVQPQPQKP
jgi:hypothetical protein